MSDTQHRLNQIETERPPDEDWSAEYWRGLLDRYRGAVHRYLVGALHDSDVAEVLFQEFALRFVRGDFGQPNQRKGRFRDYVRKVLINLVNDHHRQRQKDPCNLSPDAERQITSPETSCFSGSDDQAFVDQWQAEVLSQTWKTLADEQPGYYEVLRFQVDSPELPSREMAEQLSARLGRTMTAANVRKTLQRAREKFARLIVDEVAKGIENPTVDELRKELQQLNLLSYCRSALEKRMDKEQPH